MNTYGWNARVIPSDFLGSFTERIGIWRPVGAGEIEAFGSGGTVHRIPDGQAPGPDDFVFVPDGSLGVIRDAIDAHLGVRYDESLVKELRASLELERARVSQLIAAAVDRVKP